MKNDDKLTCSFRDFRQIMVDISNTMCKTNVHGSSSTEWMLCGITSSTKKFNVDEYIKYVGVECR